MEKITASYVWHSILNHLDCLSYEQEIYLRGFIDCVNDTNTNHSPFITKLIEYMEDSENEKKKNIKKSK